MPEEKLVTGRQSRYQFETWPDGFVVRSEDRVPVSVTMFDTGFCVRVGNQPRQLLLFEDCRIDTDRESQSETMTGLIEYRCLVNLICDGLMSEWEPPPGRTPWSGIRSWAIKRTRQALGGRIHEQWKRLTAKADPLILDVQKAVFAASFGGCSLLHEPLLYRDRLLVGDILRYRAAASLVQFADWIVIGDGGYEVPSDQIVAAMSDWQALFAPERKRYRSLSRTLMNLPGGVPAQLLYGLSELRLERPITDRLELITVLLALSESYQADGRQRGHLRTFMHAKNAEIRAAMQRVSAEMGHTLSHRRAAEVGMFAQYVCDYPGPFRGRLAPLTNRAIRWHATYDPLEQPPVDSTLQDDLPVMSPTIPLPVIPEVRFLKTVGDIRREGAQMRHCIASYIDKAITGDCYLFHIDYAGECASVEVDPVGRVRQSCGPGNSKNRATDFGVQVLQQWGHWLPNRAQTAAMDYQIPF
jgi:hypothetical protein